MYDGKYLFFFSTLVGTVVALEGYAPHAPCKGLLQGKLVPAVSE
jgi:hypothetical protein